MIQLILIFFILFSSGNTARGREDDPPECDQPNPVFNDFGDCVNYFVNQSYPFEKLNAECVLTACPQLTTVCPYNCDGSLNPEELETLGTILTSCIQTEEVICGVNIGRLTLAPASFLTSTLLDPSMANGTCSMNSGTAFIQYLNNTIFDFPSDQNCEEGPITLQLNVSFFNYQSGCTCDFNLTSLQSFPFLRPLTQMTFPAMMAQANYTLNSTFLIDPKSYETTVHKWDSQLSAGAWNFTLHDVSLPPCMVNMFNVAGTGFFRAASAEAQASRFLTAFAVSGLRGADRSCVEKDFN